MGNALIFWGVAAAILISVAAIIARALRAPAQSGEHGGAASDMAVYRDQLVEVERDRERGVLTDEEADAVRTEVARRLLDADKRDVADASPARTPAQGVGMALIAIVVIGGSGALYLTLGAPGYGDVPLDARIAAADAARDGRPGQAVAEAEVGQPDTGQGDPEIEPLLARLRDAVAQRPDDLQGARLLAQNEARQSRFIAAREAQENVIRILGQDAELIEYIRLADLTVLAAGGYVSPEAEAVLQRIFAADPTNGTARYYLGLLYAQTGRPDLAFGIWRGLLEEGPDSAPWAAPIRAQIFDLARAAGVRYTPPPPRDAPASGPTAEQMADAESMSPEDRADMIRGMVEGLSERLATEGGPAEDWARLIRALAVLGQTERAGAILTEARTAFTGDPRSLDLIAAAAQSVGLE